MNENRIGKNSIVFLGIPIHHCYRKRMNTPTSIVRLREDRSLFLYKSNSHYNRDSKQKTRMINGIANDNAFQDFK